MFPNLNFIELRQELIRMGHVIDELIKEDLARRKRQQMKNENDAKNKIKNKTEVNIFKI